jgi:hypothetical protein
MNFSQAVLRRSVGATAAATAALLALTGCSQPAGAPKDQSSGGTSGAPAASSLPTELPSQVKSWPQAVQISACNMDAVRTNADGSMDVSGWGVINAAKGEVPETFILKIEKDGATYYLATNRADRKDIATKLSNPALIRSGFSVTLPANSIKPPFTVGVILGFQSKLFPCEYKQQAK